MEKNDRMRQAIDARLSSVSLSPELRAKITAGTAPKKKRAALRLRKPLITAAAACLALVFSVQVAASVFPPFERFIANMGEDLRQLVQPLSEESTYNGIKMQVVAAVNDGDTAVIYFTLQDLAENRITPSTEIYDYSLNDSLAGMAEMVYFDEDTATATYRMESFAEEPEENRTITLQISTLLSGMVQVENLKTGLTLADIQAHNPQPTTQQAENTAGSGYSYGSSEEVNQKMAALMEAPTVTTLAFGGAPLTLPATNLFTVSNAGMVGGYLHLQQKPEGMEKYSMLEPVLNYPGASANTQLGVLNFSLGKTDTVFYRQYSEYSEYILQLPQNTDPKNVDVALRGFYYTSAINGNWKATFELDENPPQKTAECSIDMNPWVMYKVSLSSIGITAYGRGATTFDSSSLEAVVTMKDGSTVEYTGSLLASFGAEDDSFINKIFFARPIDLDNVESVVVNGHLLAFE
ncbi:MAG: hypothetical protein ACK5L3_07400 [Oscillospiraceae bacterium]